MLTVIRVLAIRVDFRTFLSDNHRMNGNELIRKLRKLARDEGKDFRIEQRRGKGSHSTLFYGKAFTIIPNLKSELKTGTFKAILKQLGIEETDLTGV